MTVVVHVRPALVDKLEAGTQGVEGSDLGAILRHFGMSIASSLPLRDGNIVVDLPDAEQARAFVEAVRHSNDVDAAYMKPETGLP